MSTYGNRKKRKTTLNRDDGHMEYNFLVTAGWEQEWNHCPLCGATNDGHYQDGTARYKGGIVNVKKPDGNPAMFACLCEFGKERARNLRLLNIDSIPDDWEVTSELFAILWIRGDSSPPPDPLEFPNQEEFSRRMSLGFRKVLRGQISQEKYESSIVKLEEQLMPPKTPIPSLTDILDSTDLRDRYFRSKPIVSNTYNEEIHGDYDDWKAKVFDKEF